MKTREVRKRSVEGENLGDTAQALLKELLTMKVGN